MSELFELSLLEAQKLLQKGEISAESLVASCLSRINATENRVGALLARRDEEALEQARAMDKTRPADFSDKPLWGIPVTVKDALTLKGLPTTAASKILEGFLPPYDAMVVKKLKDAGAVILAKNNMDEFAMGSTTEHSAYKATANPWDLSRVPGGSSGGSAASVAACQCFASLGSDTGGSIRQPAALCGCVGIKPTYGRVSRYGLLAYASSFDQVGPLARSVEDTALMLQVIAGHDERDSTSSPVPVPDYSAAMAAQQELSGLTLGLPREFFGHEGLDKGVAEACDKAVAAARDLGAKVVEVSLPHTEYSIASYYILAAAEASSNLARYDGVRYGHRTASPRNLEDMYTSSRTEGFGPEVQRRIHPARLLCAFRRLLRRLLPQGRPGAPPHPPGLPGRADKMRHAPRPRLPRARVADGTHVRRSAPDVFHGYLHPFPQPRRPARTLHPRGHERRPPRRHAAHGPRLRRGPPLPRGR